MPDKTGTTLVTTELASKALKHWGINAETITLLAQRENFVYKATARSGEHYALRIHRAGYQSAIAIQSELQWMGYLKSQEINVPLPCQTAAAETLIEIEGHYIDLLSWLDGRQFGVSTEPLQLDNRQAAFFKVGRTMAQLHNVSDQWTIPGNFKRNAWNIEGLLGENPLWDRFWDNPALSANQRELFITTRTRARKLLEENLFDYGLIHADMVRENILISGNSLQLIDFDDSGFGYRLFDVATALFRNLKEPDIDDLQNALIDGYRSLRPLDTAWLPLFMVLRSLTYIGWIINRIDEPGAVERQQRYIAEATPLAECFLRNELNS
ncbi:hypothetical protein AB833_28265 [Chromatiales bacterium (ex Bugula neritina AB1)]|nr:hypothetical protein AB833_28265 [Chromatiales bacterium (ex Bugula neritina AB1)]